MFGKKRNRLLPPVMCLYAEDMRVLFRDRIDAFPFPEAVIVAGSVEFFSDPAPCEIHRRAVQHRLCAELEQALTPNQVHPIGALPEAFRRYLGEPCPAFIAIERTV